MNKEMKNDGKIVTNNLNKSVNIIDVTPIIKQDSLYLKYKDFKKKTLRRITSDPPKELDIA